MFASFSKCPSFEYLEAFGCVRGNNIEVVATTSEKYESSFGFTQEEVWEALEEYGLFDQRGRVKSWYDGFAFGKVQDIYNPWSIINYLDKRIFTTYWANTSSNSLVGCLIKEGSAQTKVAMEDLLSGRKLCAQIDGQIVFSQLKSNENAIWRLLLATGYLRVEKYGLNQKERMEYELALTNREVAIMFEKMIDEWFKEFTSDYNTFVKALMQRDIDAMNYAAALEAGGIAPERICKYGFAFEGKKVLIGQP